MRGAGYTSSPDAMQADLTRGGSSSDGTDSAGGAGRWFEGGWDPEPEPEPSDGGSGASLANAILCCDCSHWDMANIASILRLIASVG